MLIFILAVVLVTGPLGVTVGAGVTTVDFLEVPGVDVNAAGPVLVRMDEARNRLIIANTLTSSLSVFDCGTKTLQSRTPL